LQKIKPKINQAIASPSKSAQRRDVPNRPYRNNNRAYRRDSPYQNDDRAYRRDSPQSSLSKQRPFSIVHIGTASVPNRLYSTNRPYRYNSGARSSAATLSSGRPSSSNRRFSARGPRHHDLPFLSLLLSLPLSLLLSWAGGSEGRRRSSEEG